MISFSTYAIYAYAMVPLALSIYSQRFKLCPLIKCIGSLAACIREPKCRIALDCMAECDDEQSARRQESTATFSHVQFPQDPSSLCRYQCFDLVQTAPLKTFWSMLEPAAVWRANQAFRSVLESTTHSRPTRTAEVILPFDAVADIFVGQWHKLYSRCTFFAWSVLSSFLLHTSTGTVDLHKDNGSGFPREEKYGLLLEIRGLKEAAKFHDIVQHLTKRCCHNNPSRWTKL
jgi:hypothetical protein